MAFCDTFDPKPEQEAEMTCDEARERTFLIRTMPGGANCGRSDISSGFFSLSRCHNPPPTHQHKTDGCVRQRCSNYTMCCRDGRQFREWFGTLERTHAEIMLA